MNIEKAKKRGMAIKNCLHNTTYTLLKNNLKILQEQIKRWHTRRSHKWIYLPNVKTTEEAFEPMPLAHFLLGAAPFVK